MLPRVDLIRAEENSWLLLNNNDQISDFIKKNGFWGKNESSIAKVFLANQVNTNTLDVGANIGGFTLPIAKFVASSNGKVYSYEPQRIVFQQFCANVFLNRLDNVFAYNFALGDSVCKIQIPELDFWKSNNVGAFSIDTTIRKNIRDMAVKGETSLNIENGDKNTIEQRTLDSFNFEFDINLIKVDVEGLELEFFIGGSNTIKAKKYPPIIFELWSGKNWYEQKAQKTRKILSDWGYKFSEFGREILAQHPTHPVQCKIEKKGNNVHLSIV